VRVLRIAWLMLPLILACGAPKPQPTPAAPEVGRSDRVQVRSSQARCRDLNEALSLADTEDTLELQPGRYVARLSIDGRRLRIAGPPEGGAVLVLEGAGIEVGPGASLLLESLELTTGDGPDAPAIVARGELAIRDVRVRATETPIVRFEATDQSLSVLRMRVDGGHGPVFDLLSGHSYFAGLVVRQIHGPVLRIYPDARSVHASHCTWLDVETPFALEGAGGRAPSFRYSVIEDAGGGEREPSWQSIDAETNLVLDANGVARLFPTRATGDLTPVEMPRWDRDGVDYGAVSSAAGKARVLKMVDTWLSRFEAYTAIRAIGFLADRADAEPLLARAREAIYRRVGALMGQKRIGLLVRDLALALPFSPPGWFLRDRLHGVARGLSGDIPGRIMVVGEEHTPELDKRLDRFFAQAYRWRDPNHEWRVVVEQVTPPGTDRQTEALTRQHTFVNPQHLKLTRALEIDRHRRAQGEQKKARLEVQLNGLRQQRQARSQEGPSGRESRLAGRYDRQADQLAQLAGRIMKTEAALGQTPKELTCVFKGTRSVEIERRQIVVNGDLAIGPRRERVHLSIEPEPTCGFAGFEQTWITPASETWVTDRVLSEVLARAWFKDRVARVRAGLATPRLATLESDEADTFFRLLFQDLGLIRRGLISSAVEPEQAGNDEWLLIEGDAEAIPTVSVPFTPSRGGSTPDVLRQMDALAPVMDAYFLDRFLEPSFLFTDGM
jgi:hypothetical protein